jgi:hypothetical protein
LLAFRVDLFVDETRQVGIPKNKESPLRASPRGERHLVVPEGIPVSVVFRLAALFRDSTCHLIRAECSIRSFSFDATARITEAESLFIFGGAPTAHGVVV